MARRGKARCGLEKQARMGLAQSGLARSGTAGNAWQGKLRRGRHWPVLASQDWLRKAEQADLPGVYKPRHFLT